VVPRFKPGKEFKDSIADTLGKKGSGKSRKAKSS
jgi:hypothetical protein